MFATAHRAINAYANVGLETGVEAADQHKLVLMLYDGALFALNDARVHMNNHAIAAKGQALSKAIQIISSGLKASLDMKAGGELGVRLGALYDYMCDRLLRANLHNRVEIIDEVAKLLGELRDAWAQIKPAGADEPAGTSPTPYARKA